jgi:hypothetical protein
MELVLSFNDNGEVQSIYNEELELEELGDSTIKRASHVEPCDGGWSADLSPIGGPVLGPFTKRSEALKAEHKYINDMLSKERVAI